MKARKAAAAEKPKRTRTASASKRKAMGKGAAIAENATLREMLKTVIAELSVIADRVESVRRTLWRTEAVRAYHGKADAGADTPEAKAENLTGEV